MRGGGTQARQQPVCLPHGKSDTERAFLLREHCSVPETAMQGESLSLPISVQLVHVQMQVILRLWRKGQGEHHQVCLLVSATRWKSVQTHGSVSLGHALGDVRNLCLYLFPLDQLKQVPLFYVIHQDRGNQSCTSTCNILLFFQFKNKPHVDHKMLVIYS